jgi:hypothetical protein
MSRRIHDQATERIRPLKVDPQSPALLGTSAAVRMGIVHWSTDRGEYDGDRPALTFLVAVSSGLLWLGARLSR